MKSHENRKVLAEIYNFSLRFCPFAFSQGQPNIAQGKRGRRTSASWVKSPPPNPVPCRGDSNAPTGRNASPLAEDDLVSLRVF